MVRRGFTLIELLVVMAIIGTLLAIALPRYFGSVEKSKEVTLKQSLAVMRDAIDKFYADTGRYPEAIAELAEKRYLRGVPIDPFTESEKTWIAVPPPESAAKGAVYDVRSGAEGSARDGSAYAAW
jgi:type II secretion system protein G